MELFRKGLKWEFDFKCGAFVRFALYVNRSAVQLNDLANDGHA